MSVRLVLALLLPLTILVAVISFIAHSPRDDREADWFRYQYEVRVTGPGFELIKQYLRRTRRWRAGGVVFGLGVAVFVAVLFHGQTNVFAGLFVGWFVAGLLAELLTGPPGDRRQAMLTPRTVGQFLPGFPKRVLIAATFSTLVVEVAALVVHQRSSLRRDDVPLEFGVPVAAFIVSIALAVVSVAGLRRLAHKPFPVTEHEIDVAERAIRTAASVRIAAGWGALQFIVTIWICSTVARVATSPCATFVNLLALTAFFGILVAWTFVPTRVLRRRRQTASAS